MYKYILLSLAFALAWPTQAQKQDDMRQAVEYLASQELGGRYPGTAGDTLASDYIVGKLRSLKLKLMDRHTVTPGPIPSKRQFTSTWWKKSGRTTTHS